VNIATFVFLGLILLVSGWAILTAPAKSERLPGYNRWQNFVYVRKGRQAYGLIVTSCLIVVTNVLRAMKQGALEFMGWLATGALIGVIVLYAVVVVWPLPSPVNKSDRLKSA
jgi:uncharacterized membrane protein